MAAVEQLPTSGEQVRIQLSTRHADLEFPERTGPILVSTNLKRHALSTLVNTLLGDSSSTPQPIPFQFLINEHFLRGSLSDFLNEHGISAETTLNVEYVRAQKPPAYQTSFEHDDWVGAVDVLSTTSPASTVSSSDTPLGQYRILSGCYDGILRIWNSSGQVLAMSSSAKSPSFNSDQPRCIYAAKFLSPNRIVSGGFGVPLQVFSYEEQKDSQDNPTSKGDLLPLITLQGHSAPITPFDSIAVHPPTSRILTASDDTTVRLWTIPSSIQSLAQENGQTAQHISKKRRRAQPSSSNISADIPTLAPTATLSSHSSSVTGVIFHPTQPTDAAYSVSSDRTLKTWDLMTEACVTTRHPSSDTPLSSLAALPSLSLLATGTSDRRILLVDPREDARRNAVGQMRGCGGEVTNLASESANSTASSASTTGPQKADNNKGYGLISASYDGVVRVWDVRNTHTPTYKIPREQHAQRPSHKIAKGPENQKLFSLVWNPRVGIVCGGEDGYVQINQSP